jgi:branched-subunit amino acid aminotransferase/4-amino-4-deoxychorismate lyase
MRKTKEIVFLNDKFIPKEEAKISLFEEGFLYGWGLFETMRAWNNKIVYLKQHLARIKDSSKIINIRFTYSLVKLQEIIKKTVEINGFKDSSIKLMLSKSAQGTNTLVLVKRYNPFSLKKYRQGFRACICPFRQNESSYFAKMKTTNYLLYKLAYLGAKKKGFDEAIILNSRGQICEASRSNLFFVKNKELFTPVIDCGCLDGITRRAIFDIAGRCGIKINSGVFTIQDLYGADEAFLTNSLLGVMPLKSVEDTPIGKRKSKYKITDFFLRKYNFLLKGP